MVATKKLEAEVKYKENKAEESELKNEIAKGVYIKKETITAELQRFFVVLKTSMTGYRRMVDGSYRAIGICGCADSKKN